jgi:TRAP-type C4-dicarboxylate transport system substrate-binding protein
MLISEMSVEDNSKLIKDLYAYHLALVANSGISEDSFKSVQESARKNLDQIIAVKRPWEEHNKEEQLTSEVEQYKEDMRRFFDIDLDDEEQKKAHMESWDKLSEEGHEAGVKAENAEGDLERKIQEATKRVEERRRRARRR